MDRQQLDRVVPFGYAAAIIICALWIHAALVPVAIIGALLLGVYYSLLRKNLSGSPGSKER